MSTVRVPTAKETISFMAAIKARDGERLRKLIREQLPQVHWDQLTERLSSEEQTWLLRWVLQELNSPEDTGGYCGA